MNLQKIALVGCAGALVLVAACGGSSGTSTSDTSTSTVASNPTTTVAPATTSAAPATTTTAAVANQSAPVLSGATQQAQDALAGGGQHVYYVSSEGFGQVVAGYEATLQAAGWTVQGSGGGGYGGYGGGGFTATHGASYLVVNAGGGNGVTHIDVCVWPSRPADDNCGSNR